MLVASEAMGILAICRHLNQKETFVTVAKYLVCLIVEAIVSQIDPSALGKRYPHAWSRLS